MRTVASLWLIGSIVWLATALPLWASDAARYTLRPNLVAGMGWTDRDMRDTRVEAKVLAGGRIAKEFRRSIHAQIGAQVRVLAATGGSPTAIKIAFDDDCATTIEGSETASQKVAMPLAGATVTVQKGPDGRVVNDFKGQLDAATLQNLNDELDPDNGFFPVQPVAVGDRWGVPRDKVAKIFQLGPREDANLTCDLKEVKQLEGRQVARVGVTGTVTKFEENFIEEKMQLEGEAWLDMSTGHYLTTRMKGTITMSGEQQTPGTSGQPVTVRVAGGGVLAFEQTSPLQSAPTSAMQAAAGTLGNAATVPGAGAAEPGMAPGGPGAMAAGAGMAPGAPGLIGPGAGMETGNAGTAAGTPAGTWAPGAAAATAPGMPAPAMAPAANGTGTGTATGPASGPGIGQGAGPGAWPGTGPAGMPGPAAGDPSSYVPGASFPAPPAGAVSAGTGLSPDMPQAYAGTYSGEGLTVQLKAGGNLGQFTGSIRKGQQDFPLDARCTPRGIEGKFTSGHDAFPFTASLTGTTLALDSEGSHYTLQKQVDHPANPLARPQGENPLR